MPDDNEVSNEEVKPKTIKPKARKPKPLVEGINSPKDTSDVIFVKPTLTQQEKRLISETGDSVRPPQQEPPRLLTPKAVERATHKGSGGVMSFIVWLLIFLAIGFGGYQLYGWYVQNHGTQESNVTPPETSQTAPTPEPTAQPSPAPAASPSTTPTSVATSTPVTPPAPVKQLTVKATPTGYLNVRATPSQSAAIITKVHPNETYPYTALQNGWYQITLTNGQSGWVSGQYVIVK